MRIDTSAKTNTSSFTAIEAKEKYNTICFGNIMENLYSVEFHKVLDTSLIRQVHT